MQCVWLEGASQRPVSQFESNAQDKWLAFAARPGVHLVAAATPNGSQLIALASE
jgi:hypothetical protein